MEIKDDKVSKNRWTILAIVVLLPFMATLDANIVNIALPVMIKIFSVDMASIQLIVICYFTTIVSTILFFGRLGDIKGKARVFNYGLMVFTLGSLLCGMSKNLLFLIFSRILQALGASAAMANNMGIITQVFPSKERGRALGISATFLALGTMVGPPIGGFIVTYFSWHYIFLINIPVGLLAAIIGYRILPLNLDTKTGYIDFKGAILLGISITLLFYSLMVGQKVGFGEARIVAAFFVSVGLFIMFINMEKKINDPLIDLSLFKNSLFAVGIICTFISNLSIYSNNIVQPFYLQDVLKLAPNIAGIIMMTYPMIMMVISPFSGYLSDKIGSEPLTFIGLMLIGTGMGLMSTVNQNSSIQLMCLYISVMAIGNGLFLSPNNSLVMSTAPRDKLGIAGGVNAFIRNFGQTAGVSMATILLYTLMSMKMGKKVFGYVEGRDDVFIFGMKYVYITAAFICFIGAGLTAIRLKGRMDARAPENRDSSQI